MRTVFFALTLALVASSTLAQNAPVCPKYVVQAGDSLYSIQQKFGILAADLSAALAACGQSSSILQVGQEICLPGAQLAGCSNVRSFGNNDKCKVYIVQQGDTLNSVAASLNIYAAALSSLNQDVLSAGILQPSKYLKLPPWSQSCGDPNSAGASCRVYIVTTGDFLAGIANAFGVSINDILAVNQGLSANTVLQNGEPINIPPFPASCGAGVPTKPPTDTVLRCRGYRVQQGDSIASIAQMFKQTVNDITAVNPSLAGGALVQPGTVVNIPPYDSTCTQPILVSAPNTSPSPPSSPVVVPSPPMVVPSPPTVLPSPPSPVLLPPSPPSMPSPLALPASPPMAMPPVVMSSPPPPPPPPSPAAPNAIAPTPVPTGTSRPPAVVNTTSTPPAFSPPPPKSAANAASQGAILIATLAVAAAAAL